MQGQGTNTAMQPRHVDHCSLALHLSTGYLRLLQLHERAL